MFGTNWNASTISFFLEPFFFDTKNSFLLKEPENKGIHSSTLGKLFVRRQMKAPTMLKRQVFIYQVEGPAIFWRFNGWVLFCTCSSNCVFFAVQRL